MKKYLGLLAFVLLLNGCDDGDMTVGNVDFSEIEAHRCTDGDIIYKLKDSEALFFELQGSYDAAFLNDETLDGAPRTFVLNESNRAFYRAYSGPITSDNICESIQPTTPNVTEQWTFTDGTVQIATVAVKAPNTDPDFAGGEKITRYRHHIVFAGVTISTPGGSQQQDFTFGDYSTNPANNLLFDFDNELEQCGNLIINTNGSEAFTLNIDPSLIESAVTPPGVPRIGVIGSTSNKLTYYFFNGLITQDYFCGATTPATPIISEQWNGVDGVPAVSGIIEVTTTTNGTGFLHEIHLKNVTLKKGNTSFLLATDYLFGSLITN